MKKWYLPKKILNFFSYYCCHLEAASPYGGEFESKFAYDASFLRYKQKTKIEIFLYTEIGFKFLLKSWTQCRGSLSINLMSTNEKMVFAKKNFKFLFLLLLSSWGSLPLRGRVWVKICVRRFVFEIQAKNKNWDLFVYWNWLQIFAKILNTMQG